MQACEARAAAAENDAISARRDFTASQARLVQESEAAVKAWQQERRRLQASLMQAESNSAMLALNMTEREDLAINREREVLGDKHAK